MERALEMMLVVAIVLAATTPGALAMDIKDKDLASEDSLWALYERWREHYRMARDLNDKARRFNVFKENARMIHKFNQGDAPYKLSLNLFGDMTDEEVHRAYGHCSNIKSDGCKHRRQGRFTDDAINARKDLPSSVDWRKRPSAVTNVKRQGVYCGSCWAFAATAAMEGINSIRTRNLTSLSTQQLVDCDKGNGGSKGGFAKLAFKYIMQSGGIETDAKYPYVGHEDGHCSVPKPNQNPVVTIDGYKQVAPNEVVALEQAVAAQPVVVGVDSNSTAFQRYGGGVFVGPCGTNQDHEMTVVGYGTTDKHEYKNPIRYWIVKNSWGADWGENGYIRIARKVRGQPKEGICGILTDASYPVKSSRNGGNDIMKRNYRSVYRERF